MTDDLVREEALDPARSFIVQAPAGSGKTTLLVKRFLTLLLKVENPESILAVTFTKKSAEEMRQRILNLLILESKQKNSDLAQQVLMRDRALQWGLIQNPNRLSIMTIDSLCHRLAHRLPLLSQMGGKIQMAQQAMEPDFFYDRAILDLFEHLEEASSIGEALRALSLYCDNRLDWLQELFKHLLMNRDQWLNGVIQAYNTVEIRSILERNLKNRTQEVIQQFCVLVPREILDVLEELSGESCPTQYLSLLLTQEGTFRKSISKNQGFDASKKKQKAAWKEALLRLQTLPQAGLIEDLLKEMQRFPPTVYQKKQWGILAHLLSLLRQLVSYLRLVFSQFQCVDYIEVSLSAQLALGRLDDPSELSLSLESQIQHILIDEFQDSSAIQFRLFEQLVRGWQTGDGRTLFLVGDPMQSIYRFRGAEVGLFLLVQQKGLGGVYCQPLTLLRNFRSDQQIVSWVNRTFSAVMPESSQVRLGAIAYTKASSHLDRQGSVKVYYAEKSEGFSQAEASWVASKIQEIQSADPHLEIAVLIRNKNHALPYMKAFKEKQIPYASQDLDTLRQNALIWDLLSLLKALLQPNNKLAWVSVLKGPLFGFSLSDCTEYLKDPLAPTLSDHAQQRFSYLYPVIQRWQEQSRTAGLSLWFKTLWEALGGRAAYPSLQGLDIFWQQLAQETWGSIDFERFEKRVLSTFDNAPSQKGVVQLMTLHKAKGLEFDIVFLPSLADRVAQEKSRLLLWSDYPCEEGVQWLVAPIRAYEEESEPIYDYLAYLEKRKGKYEAARLLYVGVTRAKKQCYLTMTLPEGAKKPVEGSLAALIWEQVEVELLPQTANFSSPEGHSAKYWGRISATWRRPKKLEEALALPKPIQIDEENALWQAQGYAAIAAQALAQEAAFGTTFHAILEAMSHQGMQTWLDSFGDYSEKRWRLWLEAQGVSDPVYPGILKKWIAELAQDERLAWILAPHQEAHSEWALYHRNSLVIDRCFIEQGICWIIDYKTGSASLESFEGHQAQLMRYKEAVDLYYQRQYPIKMALYYPLDKVWRELCLP